jgi:hypothetical protein
MMRLTKVRKFLSDLGPAPEKSTSCRGPSWPDVVRYATCTLRGHWFSSMTFSQFCGRCGKFLP